MTKTELSYERTDARKHHKENAQVPVRWMFLYWHYSPLTWLEIVYILQGYIPDRDTGGRRVLSPLVPHRGFMVWLVVPGIHFFFFFFSPNQGLLCRGERGSGGQPLWMYFLMTTQPCRNRAQGSDCTCVHWLVQGSNVSMLLRAGPSLLTMPPVA